MGGVEIDVAGFIVLAGVVTAAISGILGMAGGVTLLGVMTLLMPADVIVPIHGLTQLASNASRTFLFLRRVSWRLFFAYAPGLLVGVGVATWSLARVRVPYFPVVIGAFLIVFLIWRRFMPALRTLPLIVYPFLGFVVGIVTLVVGATGPIIAPFFFREDLPKEDIIATKAVCQVLGHAMKIPAFLALGFPYLDHGPLVAALIVASVVGTALGKRLLEKLDREKFDAVFQVVLFGLALWLIANGWTTSS